MRGTRTALVAGVAIAGSLVLLTGSEHPDRVELIVRHAVMAAVPLAAGMMVRPAGAARRVRYGLFGLGFILGLTALAASPDSLPYSIGRVAIFLMVPMLIYLMLAFPSGQLDRTGARLFGTLLAVDVTLYMASVPVVDQYPPVPPWTTCGTDCPPNAFQLVASEPAAMDAVIAPVREVLTVLLLAAVATTLAQRLRTATTIRRRTLVPVLAASIAITVVLVAFLVSRRVKGDAEIVTQLGGLMQFAIVAFAASFLVGLVLRRLLIAQVLGRLSLELRNPLDAAGLRRTLAAATGDESLQVRLWSRTRGNWIGPNGTTGRLGHAPDREVIELGADGAPLAMLAVDDTLRADDELLEAVSIQTSAMLRHARVNRELARSRRRLAAAASTERARIERDLHDGAQQHLVALRIKLALADELLRVDPEAGRRKVAELSTDVGLALEELRAVAHGIFPSELTDEGLAAALRAATTRFPLPVHLRVSGLIRHPLDVESALYFVCLEALQNAAKHAEGATGAWISLRERGVALEFEVRDDGAGFERAGEAATGGLRTMADRVAAIGGRLGVLSAPGEGTRVTGSVPLGASGAAREDPVPAVTGMPAVLPEVTSE